MAPKDPRELWEYLKNTTALDGEDLRGVILGNFCFAEMSLEGADLRDARLEGADFSGCNVSRANFAGATLCGASFVNAKGIGADFSNSAALAADFAMGDFSLARFCNADLERASFIETILADADFREASLTNTVFSAADVTGANLAATFVDTIFVNIDLTRARHLVHSDPSCGLAVDTKTLGLIRKAHLAGADVSDVLGVLRGGEVELPPDLAALSEGVPTPGSGPIDLMSEFAAPLHVHKDVLDSFSRVLNEARDERPLQQFIEQHPEILVSLLAANHRGWLVPQQRLGAEYIPDFLARGQTSLGCEWLAVELESPTARLFTATKREQSAELRHGIRQILDWRNWLSNNRDYARRLRQDDGLGLIDITSEIPAIILIGRRESLDMQTIQMRRRISQENNIKIHTYDYIVKALSIPAHQLTRIDDLD